MTRRYEPNLILVAIPVLLGLTVIGVWAWLTRPPLSADLARVREMRLTPPPPAWATWPWPKATITHPHSGVTRWHDASSPDGCTLELVEFDFGANPGLRLELYDQDMDDAKPYDDMADYYAMGVGQATRHLNETRPGTVIAAWNGLFFGYDHKAGGLRGMARHVGPVVLDGKARYNVGNPRWTFGIKHHSAGREYKVFLAPDKKTNEREFDYAAAGAQLLVRDRKPMRLQPFPQSDDPPLKQPVPCGPGEAGHIPYVDFMRTSRTSMGWSKDGKRFYLLMVREPDNETESKLAVKHGAEERGGWALADLQRFWLKRGVWGAVNIDGGVVSQMTCLRNDGKYDLLPPGLVTPPKQELVFDPSFEGAPMGGTLMYFYVRDSNRTLAPTRGAPGTGSSAAPRPR
jgi:hypothetical protein